jgi:hypothetical protein
MISTFQITEDFMTEEENINAEHVALLREIVAEGIEPLGACMTMLQHLKDAFGDTFDEANKKFVEPRTGNDLRAQLLIDTAAA